MTLSPLLVLAPLVVALAAFLVSRVFGGGRERRRENSAAFLRDKRVWVTGASSGIGRAVAQMALECGAARVVVSARRVEALEALRGAYGARLAVVPLDMATVAANASEAVQQALAAAGGSIDVVVQSAGISVRGTVAETALEVDRRVMEVNYFSVIALTKALLANWLTSANGGQAPTMCVVSSVQGKLGIPDRAAYAASKHALQGFLDSLRHEVYARGVRVCCVLPGYVATELSLNALTADGSKHGHMDETTARGYSPDFVAEHVWDAIARGEHERTVATLAPTFAMRLRDLLPGLLFRLVQKKMRKEASNAAKKTE